MDQQKDGMMVLPLCCSLALLLALAITPARAAGTRSVGGIVAFDGCGDMSGGGGGGGGDGDDKRLQALLDLPSTREVFAAPGPCQGSAVLVHGPISVKAGTKLVGLNLRAAGDFPVPATMLLLGSGSALVNVTADGALRAQHIVSAAEGVENLRIEDCVLHSTNNNLFGVNFSGTYIHNDVVFLFAASHVALRNNELFSAGVALPGGKVNPDLWSSVGTAVLCYHCDDLEVSGNRINQTSTAGIDISGTINAVVADNRLQYISRNIEWWDVAKTQPPLGDFITGYDNSAYRKFPVAQQFNWTIAGNVGSNSGNHGMHLSGTGIRLLNNSLTFVNQGALFLGDQHSPAECVANVKCVGLYIRHANRTNYLYRAPDRSKLPAYDLFDVSVQSYVMEDGRSFEETIFFDGLDLTPGQAVHWVNKTQKAAMCQNYDYHFPRRVANPNEGSSTGGRQPMIQREFVLFIRHSVKGIAALRRRVLDVSWRDRPLPLSREESYRMVRSKPFEHEAKDAIAKLNQKWKSSKKMGAKVDFNLPAGGVSGQLGYLRVSTSCDETEACDLAEAQLRSAVANCTDLVIAMRFGAKSSEHLSQTEGRPRRFLSGTARRDGPELVTPSRILEEYGASHSSASDSGSMLTGVATVEISSPWLTSDLKLFFSKYAPWMSGTAVSNVFGDPPVEKASFEGNLDTQLAFAIAGGGTRRPLSVYNFNTNGSRAANGEALFRWVALANAQKSPPLVQSVSFGIYDHDGYGISNRTIQRWDEELLKLASRGVTVVFASGDVSTGCTSSGKRFAPPFPSSPFVLIAGGTDGLAKRAWMFSSGGFSDSYWRPQFQNAQVDRYLRSFAPPDARGFFNASGRAFPDVSGPAANVASIVNGSLNPEAGTSAAAPVIAGLLARVNDELASKNKPPLGWVTKLLYEPDVAATFTDIQIGGDVPWMGCPALPATPFFDLKTGLGTFNLDKLLKLILR